MAFLNLNAYPAAQDGPFISTSLGLSGDATRKRVEVKTAADCTAAFDAFVAEVCASGQCRKLAEQFGATGQQIPGVSFSAYIGDRDGRKPNGYKALKLSAFVAVPREQVAA